jgi:E3 ubiquitin-protein ligase ATL6/9/15/31/42/55
LFSIFQLLTSEMRVKIEDVHRITWAHVLFIAQACLLANAETSTESPESSFDFDWKITPSMTIITVALVCFFAFLAFFSIYLRKCARSRVAVAAASAADTSLPIASSSGQDHPRRRGLDRAVIETFPVVTYSAVKGLKIGKVELECAVCLSEFEDHETLRLLPTCNHVFHSDCIDTWLTSRVTCPVCRAKVAQAVNQLAANSSQSTESSNEPTQENSASRLGEEQNHVVVDIEEAQVGELRVVEIVNRTPRTGTSGKLRRSHSTGHSPVQPRENTERYTLRLPEEVRKQLLEGEKLERSMSYGVVLATVASSRKEYRSGDVDV